MRQPDTCTYKLCFDNWEGLLDVRVIKALICSECVGVISGLIVGLHGPFNEGAGGQIGFMVRSQILINLHNGLFRIQRILVEQPMIPDLMEVPSFLGKGIHRLSQELYLHVIPPAIMVLASMQWLMEIAHKVDEVFQRLLTLEGID